MAVFPFGRGRGCILGAAGGEHREPLLPIGVTDGERQRLNGRVITPDHPARLVFFRPLAGHFPNRAEYPLDAVRLEAYVQSYHDWAKAAGKIRHDLIS